MTTTKTTEDQLLKEAIQSVKSKTPEQWRLIKQIHHDWNVINMAHSGSLSPSALYWRIKDTDASLRIDVYACIVLCDGETGLLQACFEQNSLGASDERIGDLCQELYHAIFDHG